MYVLSVVVVVTMFWCGEVRRLRIRLRGEERETHMYSINDNH